MNTWYEWMGFGLFVLTVAFVLGSCMYLISAAMLDALRELLAKKE